MTKWDGMLPALKYTSLVLGMWGRSITFCRSTDLLAVICVLYFFSVSVIIFTKVIPGILMLLQLFPSQWYTVTANKASCKNREQRFKSNWLSKHVSTIKTRLSLQLIWTEMTLLLIIDFKNVLKIHNWSVVTVQKWLNLERVYKN